MRFKNHFELWSRVIFTETRALNFLGLYFKSLREVVQKKSFLAAITSPQFCFLKIKVCHYTISNRYILNFHNK